MDVYLPSGEAYVRKAICFSMSSPFKFSGKQNAQEIMNIYTEASNFALEKLKNGSVFNDILGQQTELDDEQDKLIILDYLVIDYIREKHNINSKDFKSAVSAMDLLSNNDFNGQVTKIVNAFC